MPVHRQRSDPRASGDESSTSTACSTPTNPANQPTSSAIAPEASGPPHSHEEQPQSQQQQHHHHHHYPQLQNNNSHSADSIHVASPSAMNTSTTAVPNKPSTDGHGESAKPNNHPSNPRRPYAPKFPTMHGDKFPEGLRPELPSHFDRNLTVEKARFDPQPLVQAMASDPPRYDPPSPPHQDMHSPPLHATPKTITPSASSTGLHTPAASTFSSTVTAAPPVPPKKPQKSKSEVIFAFSFDARLDGIRRRLNTHYYYTPSPLSSLLSSPLLPLIV